MADFRRTLPLPPPGKFIGDGLDDAQRRPKKKTPGGSERESIAPPPRVPQLSASSRDLKRSKPSRRTPLLGRPEPPEAVGSELPPLERGLPPYVAKARALSAALAEAQAGTASPKVQACIERAYAAWSLDGVNARQIARVAHLAHRAYDAIRGTSRAGIESAYSDCARVLHLGLPSAMKRRIQLDIVIDLVKAMRREADGWAAVVESTMILLGWADAGRIRAAEAIRQALEQFPPESSRDEG